MIIGIDLGTTNSAAAYMQGDAPQLIPNALGESLTPSVVGLDQQQELLVGRAAKELQVLHPGRCAALFKRHMGGSWTAELGGKKFTPEQLSSLVIRSLKADAEAHLDREVTRAVITVPAYFNDDQRKATIRAGQMSGLQVERIINEPTAAAIAYGLHQNDDDKVVVVFDLGGGTFDVSVVEMFDGAVEVRSSSGESFLGGEDFTRAMAANVLQSRGHVFERVELEAPALVSRMIQQCERAKCQLTSRSDATVTVPDDSGEFAADAPVVAVTRDQMHQWTEHILAGIELPIRRAMGDAGLKKSDVDEVVLVGGATRMPMLIERVTRLFGAEPRHRLNPDEVVALGAAVQAGLIARDESLEDLVVTDVAPFTMGIEISKKMGVGYQSGYYLPVINRNTTIPVSRVETVSTLRSNQTEMRVKVYQGENRKVEDNLLLGEFVVQDVPRGPSGQAVEVRFTYDLNGVLEVEATVVETKKKARLVISKHASGISEEDIQQAVEMMQHLKTHPREETANRFLMKRAERVYRELPLVLREELSELLDGFEGALEMQEPESIDRHRDALAMFLDRFEGEGYEEDDEPDWA